MEPFNPSNSWLYGYALTGRGALQSEQPVRVGPLGKMNFLVGRNNHGKSTLLRAAGEWTSTQRIDTSGQGTTETLVPVKEADLDRFLANFGIAARERARRVSAAESHSINQDWRAFWVTLPNATNTSPNVSAENFTQTIKESVGLGGNGTPFTMSTPPHVARDAILIPAFRALRRAGENEREISKDNRLASGLDLILELDRWERPKNPASTAYEDAQKRWIKLTKFMREVLEDDDAQLEVADQTELHVRLAQAKRMLNIDDLGDGIKQVLMIAAACVYFDGRLVLLEEPEIHLHAGLQRKLVNFLATETKSQYIIATHSAHILDHPTATVFHVIHDGETSGVSSIVKAGEVRRVCHDLGYLPSDLLQANYTIWVEGPSDRIYWRTWVRLVDPELQEGVHYTIMSYGGYLVDGLHLRDEAHFQDDLVSILQLGRMCTLVTDSDKTSSGAPTRPTVERLRREALNSESGTLVVCDWVRTVENLIPRPLFRKIVIESHPRAGERLRRPGKHGPYDEPFYGMSGSAYSKVKIAQQIVGRLHLSDMDEQLHAVVTTLTKNIRHANGL